MKFLFTAFLFLGLSAQPSFAKSTLQRINDQDFLNPEDPKPKTIIDYWRETGLKFNEVSRVLTSKNCYQEEKKFIGCYIAAKSLVEIYNTLENKAGDKKTLQGVFLSSMKGKDMRPHRVLGSYGPLEVLEFDRTLESPKKSAPAEKKTLSKEIEDEKQETKQTYEKIKTAYNATINNPIDFGALTSWIATAHVSLQPDFESLVTALTLNEYLKIVKDPHTSLEPIQFWQSISKTGANVQKYFGIGAELFKGLDGKVWVVPIRGSPALKGGLHTHDILIKVDDEVITEEMTTETIAAKIKGSENSPVRLLVKRGEKELELTVIRGMIETGKNVEAYLVKDSRKKVGYIRLNDFMEEGSCEDVNNAVKSLTKQKAKGIILDLRSNGGGSLSQAACIVSIFVRPNQLVVRQTSLVPGIENQEAYTASPFEFETEEGKPPRVLKINRSKLPMVTLIDSQSASASEIVSGALQYYRRSLIVGVRSYGKATVQHFLPYGNIVYDAPFLDPFSDNELGIPEVEENLIQNSPEYFIRMNQIEQRMKTLSMIAYKVTLQRFDMASGFSNQLVGIHPEIEVWGAPDPTDDQKVVLNGREEDEYSTIPPVVTVLNNLQTGKKPFKTEKIKACMKKRGSAADLFKAREHDALLPDYQLLSAQDALSCM